MTGDMSIATRTGIFGEVLRHTVVTDGAGIIFELEQGMSGFCERLLELRSADRCMYIIGNGGSAAVAGHAVTDFFNMAGLKATTLHESSLLTCMTNDYGYENAFARMLERMVQPEDVVIAISSSGQSMNIRNAAQRATQNGAFVVTLSGFEKDNPLRSLGGLNFWLDSHDYGIVEIGHQFILHNISDRIRDMTSG